MMKGSWQGAQPEPSTCSVNLVVSQAGLGISSNARERSACRVAWSQGTFEW